MSKPVKYLIGIVVSLFFVWYIASIIINAATTKEIDYLQMWTGGGDQGAFWKKAIKKWNESGKGMRVKSKRIPVAQSSEEAILNSIAGQTSPDICTGIFPGFGAQLASLGAISSLNEFESYNELVHHRKMEKIMKGWEYESKNYVFPLFSCPVLYWWRGDIMEELGWNKIPETYSEVYEFCKLAYIPRKRYGIRIMRYNAWWGRWIDFISFYYAASGGKPYVVDNKAVLDNKYGREVMEFFKKLYDNNYSSKIIFSDPGFFEGTILGSPREPQDLTYAKQQFPKILDKIKIGPVPVPDNHKGEVITLSDTKGLVIFKDSKYKEEAWKFLEWFFLQDDLSREWMELTTMPPARGDLLTNPVFTSYFKENEKVAEYAKYVSNAVPAIPLTRTIDVQEAMTDDLMQPIIYNTQTVDEALKNTAKKINESLSEY